MSSMNEDKYLVEKAIQGEIEAFEMIIQKYQQPLLNYIGRMVGERELALDFTQEVFIKTYSSLHSYKPQFKFSTWLYRIASNFIIDYWRKKSMLFRLTIKKSWIQIFLLFKFLLAKNPS